MNKNLTFSVIVPCYNQEKYLFDCLDSIKKQSFKDWECIIVNDGSTDGSEDIAKEFVKNDSRFIYKYKKNSGLASTRNYGINASSGTYILPLDGDDKIGVNYLTKAHKIFNDTPETKIVYCKARLFGDLNRKWKLKKYSYKTMLYENCIFCSAIFRKADFDLTNGYDSQMIYGYEDWEFWLQLLNNNDIVTRIKSVEFFYRKRGDSMINFINNQENLKKMTDYIIDKHKLKYNDALKIDNTMAFYGKIISTEEKLLKIKKSISYKTIYKIEKEIISFIERFN